MHILPRLWKKRERCGGGEIIACVYGDAGPRCRQRQGGVRVARDRVLFITGVVFAASTPFAGIGVLLRWLAS